MLKALGWSTENPNDVRSEEPTFDGKAADYVLLAQDGDRTVLIVEAKALGKSLGDAKAVGQVVPYANNAGIEFCVLTNGVVWMVYSTFEHCPAPKKLMFRVSLDPRESKGKPIKELAEIMARFSRSKINALGDWWQEARKNMTTGDSPGQPARETDGGACSERSATLTSEQEPENAVDNIHAGNVVGTTKKDNKRHYDEADHLDGVPENIVDMYREIDRYCLSLGPEVKKIPGAIYIGYYRKDVERRYLCLVFLQKKNNRIKLATGLEWESQERWPEFAETSSNGKGHVDLFLTDVNQLPETKELINKKYELLSSLA